MKTIKHFLLFFFLFSTILAKAEKTFLPDEVWYDTGKDIYIQFRLHSVFDISKYADEAKTFANLYNMNLAGQAGKTEKDRRVGIKIDEINNDFNISELGEYSLVNSIPREFYSGSNSDFQELKLITKEGIQIDCYFKSIGQFFSFLKDDWKNSISKLSDEINKQSSGLKRKAFILFYQNKGDEILNISKEVNSQVNNLDMLLLSGGIGVNLFKSKILPSIEARTGLVFSKKGILSDGYYVNIEIINDFVDDNGKLVPKLGQFMDLGYMHNFSKTPDKADWYGFSFGYLLTKNADIFDDHTWRLSVHRNISKNIELVPQLYFPENFGKIFPGIKLNVSF